MRLALAFGRPDVDGLLAELTHEQYREWINFLTLEPHGWQATRLMTQRLSYITAQAQSRKRLRPEHFDIKVAANIHSEATEKARWEAMSIRQNIASRRRRRPNEKRNG